MITDLPASNLRDETTGLVLGPIRTPQLYEQIVGRIKHEVAAGTLPPGARLPSERDMARTFRVGRPSVREAIAALQNEGIVFTRAGAGSFVAPEARDLLSSQAEKSLGEADVSPVALLDIRAFLDPGAAEVAARRGRSDERAESLLAQMEGVPDVSDAATRTLWGDWDRLFHRQIALMTVNPFFVEFAERVAEVMDQPLWRRLRDEATSDLRRVRLFAAEHRMIYEAVATGDPDAAATLARAHVLRVRRHMGLD
jgi:DNA-binding FadR family transcriptional regulator